MNEGHLGKYSFGGERAATDNHPAVIHYLPLAEGVTDPLAVGTLLKAVDVYGATATTGEDNTGVTAAFAAKAGKAVGAYAFAYDSAWKLGGQGVTLSEYGISLTGDAANGDTVTVTLTVEDVTYEPVLSTDAEACAVVDLPCDPTGEKAETSAAAVVHGTVKTRVLKTGDGKAPTGGQLAMLARHGVFAV